MSVPTSFKTAAGTELPIMNLKGKPYLQVPHRILWFREEKPDWRVETSFSVMNDKLAVAKAEVRDSSGNLMATAHKSETPGGFGDYIEKAETGAVGRALALVGYGTQFTNDFEEDTRLADSPVQAPVKNYAPVKPASTMPPPENDPNDRFPEDMPAFDEIVEPQATNKMDPTLETYVPTFGKFKGVALKDIPPQDIRGYIQFLTKGDPPKGAAKAFVENASAYLKQVESAPSPLAGTLFERKK